jgi:hypothetical protein
MNQMKKYQEFHQSGVDRLERQKILKDIPLKILLFCYFFFSF